IEMAIMLLMPSANAVDAGPHAATILFAVFMLNRVISGAAEAAASGADEALAYDSLPEEGRDQHWSKLTTRLMVWQSISFILVTLIGAAVYDNDFLNKILLWVGVEANLTQQDTLKYPIFLTLGMAIMAFIISLRMREPNRQAENESESTWQSIRTAFKRTLRAGQWILQTPAALMLMLIGLSYDSVIRLYYTVGSIWMEVIGYRPAQLGIISVAGSLVGILAAYLGKQLIEKRSPNFNFRFLGTLVFIGIVSLAFPIPYWSVCFVAALWLAMRCLHFFLSNYLNRVTDSDNRATVLSFRGLTMNLSYGLITFLYGMQSTYIRKTAGLPEQSNSEDNTITHFVFKEAAQWWWVYLLAITVALVIFQRGYLKRNWNQLLEKQP
ncbi:MAG: MFS transporter, partial [Verrucomicrobiota bacterium]